MRRRSDIYRGRTALITGASSGIGASFAAALAARGMDLILTARSRDRLKQLATELADAHGGHVEVMPDDLARAGAGQALAERIVQRGLQVDFLINNAGFGTVGPFHKQDPGRERAEVLLNVLAGVELSHAFLPAMIERSDGAIINVASVAAFQPTPFMTIYGATKAFVLAFSEGLWGECRNRGVRVLALCPGPVDTAFFEATGKSDLKDKLPAASLMQADEVVREGLRALERNRSFIVPGRSNYAVSMMGRLLPRGWVAAASARVLQR